MKTTTTIPKHPSAQADNVSEPVVADEEARKRIQELVRIRRQQMHAEELAAAKEKSKQQPEVVVETQEHKAERYFNLQCWFSCRLYLS
jgi:hypothetical protein